MWFFLHIKREIYIFDFNQYILLALYCNLDLTTYHYITESCICNYKLIINHFLVQKLNFLLQCLKIHSRKELIPMNQCVKSCTETLIQYYSMSQTLSLTRELICVSWCETSIAATGVCCCLEPWIPWGKNVTCQIILN